MLFPEILVGPTLTLFYLRDFSTKISIDSQALSNKEKVGMRSELDIKVALIQKCLRNTQCVHDSVVHSREAQERVLHPSKTTHALRR